MKYSYSIEQIRAADKEKIESGTPSLELMQRAAKVLSELVAAEMARLKIDDVLFVCGGGNNGGDGFCAAQILCEQGFDAAVLCLAEKFSPDCNEMKNRFKGELFTRIPRRRYAVLVDCVLGTGLSREPEGDSKTLIEFINSSGAYVIACDLPSGLKENGIASEACVVADKTLTIGALKNTLFMADGVDVSGEIEVADLGLALPQGAEIWQDDDVKRFFPRKKSHTHKGVHGSACLLGGLSSVGASFLAAEACLKSGVGFTKFYLPSEIYPYAVGRLPACIMRAFTAIDDELLSADCIAVGMGAGVSETLYRNLEMLLKSYKGTLVLDADALNTLAVYGIEVLKDKACKVIITPHPKEFARLTKRDVKSVLKDAVEVARQFALDYSVTVLLKNNRTVITNGERVAINPTGSPVLARGGSGDVLSGFLAGTCARGIDAFEAACTASYLLGRAGEIAAMKMGEYAPVATDIISYFPQAIMEIS